MKPARILVESPDSGAPLDVWMDYRKRLDDFPADDAGIADFKAHADAWIAHKREQTPQDPFDDEDFAGMSWANDKSP